MTEKYQIPPALTDDLKKKLQAQFTCSIEYEFYEVAKSLRVESVTRSKVRWLKQ
jgi:hypothetical protein